MKLVVGLGNPGQKYEKTRHNIGFVTLDAFVEAERLGKFVYNNKFSSEIFDVNINTDNRDNEKVVFVKPMLFMNKSGTSIKEIMDFYKIKVEDVLILHDEIDHDLGSVKLKLGGGHAGHNGLRDIICKIGKDFSRIRIGIGRPINKEDVVDYVLGKFSKKEKYIIEDILPLVFENINLFLN